MARRILSSNVGQLSQKLLTDFFECDEDGKITDNSPIVRCMIPEGGLTERATFNWNQPFENSGVESKAPAIAALLQTGQASQIANSALGNLLSSDIAQSLGINPDPAQALDVLNEVKGRTGITLLNSRQVFSGMPPITYSATLIFRAWSDSAKEVEAPIEQLKQWAYLKKLDKESRVLGIAGALGSLDLKGAILAALPSEIPSLVGFSYGGKNYSPMVIESYSDPLAVNRDEQGRILVQFEVELASLTALDRNMRLAMLSRKNV